MNIFVIVLRTDDVEIFNRKFTLGLGLLLLGSVY